MSIYGISDLHFSFSVDKPMNIFGKSWDGYEEKIFENWNKIVKEDDLVIIAGDISWGMYLSEAKKDFEYLHKLPGKKIILKGNHDYYFQSKKKMEDFFKSNKMDEFKILQTNAILTEDAIICGSRGWGDTENKEVDDEKLIRREAIRFEIALKEAMKLKEKNENKKIILVTHFPPFLKEFQEVIKKYPVDICIYGHLHGFGHSKIKEGLIDNVNYKMVGCDYTKFKLVKII